MILFLYGGNEYAIMQQIGRLREQYAKKYADALEEVSVEAAVAGLGGLESALLAQPTFFTTRLVIVHGLQALKSEAESIRMLLEKIPETTVAVIDGRGLDRRSRLFKDLTKLPRAKEYPRLSAAQLASWLVKEANRLGARLTPMNANLLLKRVGPDEWRLANELAKLTAGRDEITAEVIRELVPERIEDSVFDLIAAVKRGDSGSALALYDRLMSQGASEQQLIATLQWQYRVMAMVAASADDTELAKLGIKPYAATRTRQELRGISHEDIAAGFEALLEADRAIKTGEKTQNQAMTDLIIVLARTAR